MKDKRVVFMGTPDFAVPILEMLIKKHGFLKVKGIKVEQHIISIHHRLQI